MKDRNKILTKKIEKLLIIIFLGLFFLSPNAYADAVNDSFSTTINTNLTANVLDNDTGYEKQVTNYWAPSHGTILSFSSNGDFVYQPDQGYTGTDTFVYEMEYVDFWGWETDTATVTINITNSSGNSGGSVGNADDLCYGDMQTSGLQFGPFGFMTTTTIPIKNLSNDTLSNVHVALGTSSLFSAFSDCGVNGTSGNCQNASGLSFMAFSAFNNGIDYTLPNYSSKETQTVYNSAIFSFLDSGYDLVATYTKNGQTYQGKLKQCNEVNNNVNNPRPFTMQERNNIRGNIVMIGNSVLQSYNGACVNTNVQNNDIYAYYADEDNDNDTYNSTSANLVLPKGVTSKDIVYALLYWQGRTNSNTQASEHGRNIEIKFYGSSDYKTVTSSDYKFNYIYGDYQGSTDVTKELKASMDSLGDNTLKNNGYNKPVWVANLYTVLYNNTWGHYNNYGAWSLIVTYKDKNEKLRNITLYDGYNSIYGTQNNPDTKSYLLKDFLTPTNGEVDAKFMVFAGEGDVVYPDSISLTNKEGAAKYLSPKNDFFHSSEDIDGVNITNRNPNCQNTIGIDLRTVSVGTNAKTPIIGNGQTQTTVTLSSTGDQYFPGVFAFSTQLYEPRVCYYIDNVKEDDNNNTVFENGQFVSGATIDPTKQYTFSLWIANMPKNSNDTNIENAKKVQIYVHAPDFNYTSNSTQIQNIGWNDYKNITDQTGDDIGEYNNITENFTWRLGTGANATQGGEMDVAKNWNDDKSKAFIKLKGKFSSIGNNQSSMDMSSFYDFKASYQTNSITITPNDALPIEACVGMDTSTNVYVHPQGLFDAWDTFRSINDRNISTKIVGQPFNLTIASINSADDATETKDNIDIQYQLYDMNHKTSLTPWQDYNASSGKDGASATKSFTVNKASKNVRVRFKFCGHNNGSGIVLSSLSGCSPADINTSTFSSDNFAIRPNKFYIDINGTAPRKAGKNYDIDFEALDENNKSSKDYNETAGNSFQIDINETKPGCKTGIFQPNIENGWHFNDGNYSVDENYSEVGKVQITIKENKNCSSRFAGVDCKDKNVTGHWNTDSNLTIKPFDENITFTPDHFKVNATLSNDGNGFTYLSKDLNMSAILDINVTAETKNNTITTNYNSACYAQKTDYNISYANLNISPSNALTRILYIETNTSTKGNNSINSNDINLTNISSSIFSTDNNGTGSIHLKINFDRNTSNAVNPFDLNITDINVTDANGTKGVEILDKNATFYYGRIHAPDYSSESNTTINNAKIYYEVYCKDCNKTKFTLAKGKESVDSIYWYINNSHVSKDGNISNFLNSWTHSVSTHLTFTPQKSPNNISNGIENHTITYNGNSYPYKENVDMNASSWLVYNEFNETAKYNSFNVEFYGVGGWSGVGETGNTVDLNISTKKSKRIEW